MPKTKKYPTFELSWTTSQGDVIKKCTTKQTFISWIKELQDLKTFKHCNWTIEYAPRVKARFRFEDQPWEYFRNSSIVYSDPAVALSDAELFTNEKEMKTCIPLSQQ